MAELSIIDTVGSSPTTMSTATGTSEGDTFANDGSIIIYLENTSVSDTVVRFSASGKLDGGFLVRNENAQVQAGLKRFIGPFPTRYFNDENGKVNISYDDPDDIQIGAIRVSR